MPVVGKSDGIATVSVTGGLGPYTYLWSPGGQTTPFIISIPAGTYIVVVTDSKNCSKSISITVANATGPTATITSSDSVTCHGGNDGLAIVGQ